jgi:hypothetical protein
VTGVCQLAQRLQTAGQLRPTTGIVEAKTLAYLRRQFAAVGDRSAFQQFANIADTLGFQQSTLDLVLYYVHAAKHARHEQFCSVVVYGQTAGLA